MKTQFAHNRASVGLDCLGTDSKRRGDFLVSHAFGQQPGHYTLPLSEHAESRILRFRSGAEEGVEEGFRDYWREIRLTLRQSFDGLDNPLRGLGLQDISARAGDESLPDQLYGFACREDEDFGIGERAPDLPRRLQTVQFGH